MLSAVLTGACRPWAAVWHLGIPGLDPGYVSADGLEAVEVNRPDRSLRRRHGKSDPIDATSPARSTTTSPTQPPSRLPFARNRSHQLPYQHGHNRAEPQHATPAPTPSHRWSSRPPVLVPRRLGRHGRRPTEARPSTSTVDRSGSRWPADRSMAGPWSSTGRNRGETDLKPAARMLGVVVAMRATPTRRGEYDHHPIPSGGRGDRAAQVVR